MLKFTVVIKVILRDIFSNRFQHIVILMSRRLEGGRFFRCRGWVLIRARLWRILNIKNSLTEEKKRVTEIKLMIVSFLSSQMIYTYSTIPYIMKYPEHLPLHCTTRPLSKAQFEEIHSWFITILERRIQLIFFVCSI